MKKLYIIFVISLFSIYSCSLWDGDEELFKKAYKEILIIRELNPDTASANKEVQEAIKKYGFTERSFRDEFIKLTEDKQKFADMLDTIREEARREIIKIQQPEKKK